MDTPVDLEIEKVIHTPLVM